MSNLLAAIGIALSLLALVYYADNPEAYASVLPLLGIGASMIGLSLWMEAE